MSKKPSCRSERGWNRFPLLPRKTPTPNRQIRGVDVNGNSLSNDFYHNLLSGTYKQAYDQIYAALYNAVQAINLSVSVKSSDIATIVYCVYYVCAGYAHAFQYCMQKLGIPAAYIVGYAGEAHAWNLLQLGGEYYCMDVT